MTLYTTDYLEYYLTLVAWVVNNCQSASNSFQVSASKFFQLLRLI